MKKILIVEDEVIFYKNLKDVLKNEGYIVSNMADSVEKAISLIRQDTPDLALLDIKLKGDRDGVDLAELLHNELNIPFIFITQADDDATFNRILHLKPDHFMVKTKPFLNKEELIRSIKLALKRHELGLYLYKKGVFGLTAYLEDIRDGHSKVTRVPVNFDEIAFFTKDPWIDVDNYESELIDNYSWFLTKNNKKYLIKLSLTEILNNLPENFARINGKYIVNILPEMFDGRINGSKVSILKKEIEISRTYKARFNKKLEQFYIHSQKK